jgi:hypothetical protein
MSQLTKPQLFLDLTELTKFSWFGLWLQLGCDFQSTQVDDFFFQIYIRQAVTHLLSYVGSLQIGRYNSHFSLARQTTFSYLFKVFLSYAPLWASSIVLMFSHSFNAIAQPLVSLFSIIMVWIILCDNGSTSF